MKINHLPTNANIGNITDSGEVSIKLKSGDVIRGKLIDVKPDEVTLRLYNGSEVRINVSEPLIAKQGQIVELMVSVKEDNTIVLTNMTDALPNLGNSKPESLENLNNLILENNNKVQNTQQQLNNASNLNMQNSSQYSKEIDITNIKNQLMSNHTYPSNDLVNKVIDLMDKYSSIDAESAAFAVSNDIQNDNKLMVRLMELVAGKADVAHDIEALVQSLSEIEDESVLKDIYTKLSSNNIGHKEENITSIDYNSPNEVYSKVNGNEKSPNIITDELSKIMQNVSADEDGLGEKKAESKLNIGSQSSIEQVATKISIAIASLNQGYSHNDEINDLQTKDQVNEKLVLNQQTDIDSDGNKDINANTILEELKQEATNLKQKADLTHKQTLLADIKDVSTKPEEKLDRLKELFLKDIPSLSKATEADDINLKRIYKVLLDKLEAVKSVIEESSISNRNQILSTIDRIDTTVRFSNEISTYSAYAQIPFNLGEKSKSGELYILRKKGKGKKINRDDTTVFITLDTMNMGRVDTLINVKHKNVSVNVGVMKEAFFEYVKDNHKSLYEGLKEKGYMLVNLNCKLITQQINVTNVIKTQEESKDKGYSKIDYKL